MYKPLNYELWAHATGVATDSSNNYLSNVVEIALCDSLDFGVGATQATATISAGAAPITFAYLGTGDVLTRRVPNEFKITDVEPGQGTIYLAVYYNTSLRNYFANNAEVSSLADDVEVFSFYPDITLAFEES